ncbi:hypothetical protein M5E88_04310 [Akkermansia muciniphila]|nr:hypothetical protein M5E88_04310 [Akkermansia muciniphila]
MSELGNFIAFQAAVSLIKQHGQARLLEEVYKACREELAKPKEERRNCVKAIYEGLTEAEISRKSPAWSLRMTLRAPWKSFSRPSKTSMNP